jgi:hypothetical protein
MFPGWERLEEELAAAVDAGDDMKLSTIEVMTVLGEVQRLQRRLDQATQLLGQVAVGNGCWHAEQGYTSCPFPGIDRFLAATPKRRRWWRR